MEKDIINIVVWALVGGLGIACSYYSSSYIASGITHFSANYLNVNLNLDTVENFVFGSLCLTIVTVVAPHMLDSFINIAVSNLDCSSYSAAYEASKVSELFMTQLVSDHKMYLTDFIKPVTNILANPETVDLLNTTLRNKNIEATIIMPKSYYDQNIKMYGYYLNEGIFNQIPFEVLIQDAPNLRQAFLANMLNFNSTEELALSLYDCRLTVTSPELLIFLDNIKNNTELNLAIQLLDTFNRAGSGAGGVSFYEVLMRVKVFEVLCRPEYIDVLNTAYLYVDGSSLDLTKIHQVKEVLTYHTFLTSSEFMDMNYENISQLVDEFNYWKILEKLDDTIIANIVHIAEEVVD